MRYLDPKNDLTFKKVFGEHPHLLKSFLNSVLPLGDLIDTLEYLPAELVPEIPVFKNSIVDVRCVDVKGRQFIVEMQMLWTDSFKNRVVFNASKAFVKQIERGEEYKGLQPVYSLSIVNEIFEPQVSEYMHHYKIVHSQYSHKVIHGLEFIFIELPKFKAKKLTDKKLNVLWLRYLSEINDSQEELSPDFMEVSELREATELLKESSFSKAQLETYDKYWDSISTEKTLMADAFDEGKTEGKIEMARSLKKMDIDIEAIVKASGLSRDEIEKL
ncbi:MAG: Rpn family recombination-promoting nuclease/putative transposase [Flavobacterium sp.]